MDRPDAKRTDSESGVDDDGVHGNSRSQYSLPSPSPSSSPSPSLPPSPSQALAPKTTTTNTKSSKTKAAPPSTTPSQQPVLVICRNKHWRYISSFHGPWLQLPPEVLETIANVNYNTPRPRPIDPAVFFDLVKIRRLVEDATDLAVRAASGVTSLNHRGLTGAAHHAASLGLGFGRPPPQAKLSAERKYKMREQACQRLAEAYRRDEIACSVATMQGASSLDEVASLVLQRNPHAPDAKYVHFFHEKIPSRQVADSTSLVPLDDVIAARRSDPEPLRTRALIRTLKGDLYGALDDLTDALRVHRLHRPATHASSSPKPPPPPSSQDGQSGERPAYSSSRGPRDIILKEDDRPSSLEMQLLFHRAGLYLTIAFRCVPGALGDASPGEALAADPQQPPAPPPPGKEAQRKMADLRKLMRQSAKRALRDYTAFLSHLDYSPDLPIEIAEDFARKVNSAIQGTRVPRSHGYPSGARPAPAGEGEDGMPSPHRVFALSDLFTSAQPLGLPPFPATDLVPASRALPSPSPASRPVQTTTETLTGHPLLTDALHSLLLCHALIQTSQKELLRHAYMVARLTRLSDGYPLFQSSRSPARADWMDVVRGTNNWVQLAGSWEELCAPVPLPLFQSAGNGATPVPVSLSTPNPVKALPAPSGGNPPTESPAASTELAKQQVGQQLDSPTGRLTNEDHSLRQAIRARRLRAAQDYRLDSVAAAMDATVIRAHQGSSDDAAASPAATKAPAAALTTTSSNGNSPANPAPNPRLPAAQTSSYLTRRRAAQSSQYSDEGREGAASDRATMITRWVLHAPLSGAAGGAAGVGGLKKRRRKPAKKAGGEGGLAGPGTGGDEEGDGEGEGEGDGEGDEDAEEA